MFRWNGDEARRELERAATTGDRTAALRLLSEWRRSGQLGKWTQSPDGPLPETTHLVAEATEDELGRVGIEVDFQAANLVTNPVRFRITLHDIRRRRTRGFVTGLVLVARAESPEELAYELADGTHLADAVHLNGVVSPRGGAIDLRTIMPWDNEWQSRRRRPGHGLPEAMQTVALEEFWSDPAFRSRFLDMLWVCALSYRLRVVDHVLGELADAENAAARVVAADLRRRNER